MSPLFTFTTSNAVASTTGQIVALILGVLVLGIAIVLWLKHCTPASGKWLTVHLFDGRKFAGCFDVNASDATARGARIQFENISRMLSRKDGTRDFEFRGGSEAAFREDELYGRVFLMTEASDQLIEIDVREISWVH